MTEKQIKNHPSPPYVYPPLIMDNPPFIEDFPMEATIFPFFSGYFPDFAFNPAMGFLCQSFASTKDANHRLQDPDPRGTIQLTYGWGFSCGYRLQLLRLTNPNLPS
jgi:hypothetical protein